MAVNLIFAKVAVLDQQLSCHTAAMQAMIEGLGILLTRTTAPPPAPVMMPEMTGAGPSTSAPAMPGRSPACHVKLACLLP